MVMLMIPRTTASTPNRLRIGASPVCVLPSLPIRNGREKNLLGPFVVLHAPFLRDGAALRFDLRLAPDTPQIGTAGFFQPTGRSLGDKLPCARLRGLDALVNGRV